MRIRAPVSTIEQRQVGNTDDFLFIQGDLTVSFFFRSFPWELPAAEQRVYERQKVGRAPSKRLFVSGIGRKVGPFYGAGVLRSSLIMI